MKRRWERWALAGVVLLYLVTGTIYSLVTPVFEAPDESFHFFVVKHIVDHHTLPVQRAETRGLWQQEGSQPPLYYLVGALLVGWIDLSDAESLLWRNPQANIGDPFNPGNKNVYIHPPEQCFPWRGAVLAVHALRFFSLALGGATVILLWGTVRLLFPRQSVLALVVGATTAFIPQFLFITSSVNNDNAMTCLGTLSLYLLFRRLRDGGAEGGLAKWYGLGAVLGLALLSKLSALALLGMVGGVLALVAWYRRSWRALWRLALAVGLPAFAVAGWWYVRNVALYGEPTGLTAMWEVVGRRNDFGADLWGEFRGLRYSFWGLFGWFSMPLPDWVYRVLDVFSILALAGLLLEIGRWVHLGLWQATWSALHYRDSERGPPYWGAAYRPLSFALMAIWLGIVFVSLLRWTSLTSGTQGRLLYPAIMPIALYLFLGLRAWFWYRVRDAASVALALGMFALGLVVPWLWIAPHYVHPAPLNRLPERAVPLDLRFGETITLRGVSFRQEVAYPGEPFRVDLYWETDRSVSANDEVMIWLRMIQERPRSEDVAKGVVGLEDSYPGAGTFPISLWPVGQLLAGRQYIRVGTDTLVPMVVRLDIALYAVSDGRQLPYPGEDLPTIGRVKVVPRRWPRVRKGELVARFDCGVSLAQYDRGALARAGGTLPVTLTWTVQSPPRRDYVVFVHLEDERGTVWGYGDGAPREGNYPTWWWEAGEVVADPHTLVLADDAPPGQYRVVVGLYHADGRVPAYAAGGERLFRDAVDLGTVEVR